MIEVEEDVLTVSGRHGESQEEKDDPPATCGESGASDRLLARPLPVGVDAKQIKAEVRDRGDGPPAHECTLEEDRDHAAGCWG
jgi:HSP20 family molecular chaperone IbpA